MVDDWIAHTPKSILAKNFGLNESVFKNVPTTDPYILNATVSTANVSAPNTQLSGNSSFVYRTFQHPSEPVPGNGGTFYKIDSTNFPIAKTIAATYVTLKPGGLREMHWHPNVSAPRPNCFQGLTSSAGRGVAVLPQGHGPRHSVHRKCQLADL